MPDSAITSNTALLATDRHGSVLRQHAVQACPPTPYTAFGFRPIANELPSVLGFNGQLQELRTGDYLLGNGYRAYNPVLMRFLSPDSVSPFGNGGCNSYVYCSGDPVNALDPSGHVNIWVRTGRSDRPIPQAGAQVTQEWQVQGIPGVRAQTYDDGSNFVLEQVLKTKSPEGETNYIAKQHLDELTKLVAQGEQLNITYPWEQLPFSKMSRKNYRSEVQEQIRAIFEYGRVKVGDANNPEVRHVTFVVERAPSKRSNDVRGTVD